MPFLSLVCQYVRGILVGLLVLMANPSAEAGDGSRKDDSWTPCETATLEHGELIVVFRDNSQSPRVLSGVDSLFNRIHSPDFDAFDPDSPGLGWIEL